VYLAEKFVLRIVDNQSRVGWSQADSTTFREYRYFQVTSA